MLGFACILLFHQVCLSLETSVVLAHETLLRVFLRFRLRLVTFLGWCGGAVKSVLCPVRLQV